MKKSLKIFPFLITFLFILPSLSSAAQYKVIRIVDGDTIIVNYQKNPEKVRLLRVNTPESVHPDKNKISPWERLPRITPKRGSKGNTVTLNLRDL